MKVWKRALVFGMSLMMAVPFAACDKKKDKNSVDDSSSSSQGVELTNVDFLSVMEEQVKNTQTVQLTGTMSAVVSFTVWEEDWETGAITSTTVTDGEVKISYDMAITKVGESYNAKMVVTGTQKGLSDESDQLKDEMYIIDGYTYTYDETNNVYYKDLADMTEVETVKSMVSSLFKGLALTADEKASLNAIIGESIKETFTISNNVATYTVDEKALLNEVVNYVKGIDPETKTVRNVLDDELKRIDENLTTAVILAKVQEVTEMTPDQAITAIDAWLTEKYQTTLQGIYDTIVNDARLAVILQNFFAVVKGVPEAEASAQVQELLTQLKAIKIADLVKEYFAPDQTIFDLIVSLTSGASKPNMPEDGTADSLPAEEEPQMTLEQVMATVNAMLDSTLAQVMGESVVAIDAIASINVNSLSESMSIAFDKAYKISEVTRTMDIDLDFKAPTGYTEEGKEWNSFDIDAEVEVKITFSDSALTVALPERAEIVDLTEAVA